MAERSTVQPAGTLRNLVGACKRLDRNPYIGHSRKRWLTPRLLLLFLFLYVVITVLQYLFDTGLAAGFYPVFKPAWRYGLQAVLIQQHKLLYALFGVIIPTSVALVVILERQRNRLDWVRLTPISAEEIVVGIIGRALLPALLLFVLELPLFVGCLVLKLATVSYALATIGLLMASALFFPAIGFVVGLLAGRSMFAGVLSCLVLFFGSALHLEYSLSQPDDLREYFFRMNYTTVNPLTLGDNGLRLFPVAQEIDGVWFSCCAVEDGWRDGRWRDRAAQGGQGADDSRVVAVA